MVESEVATVIALIVILSFAIDRIVSGMLFLLSFSGTWSRRFADPTVLEPGSERAAAEKRYKLIYAILAGLLSIIVLCGFANVRVLAALGVHPHEWAFLQGRAAGAWLQWLLGYAFVLLDTLITGLILTAGADRVAHLMRWIGGGKAELSRETAEPKPLQIVGKLTLEEGKGVRLSEKMKQDE